MAASEPTSDAPSRSRAPWAAVVTVSLTVLAVVVLVALLLHVDLRTAAAARLVHLAGIGAIASVVVEGLRLRIVRRQAAVPTGARRPLGSALRILFYGCWGGVLAGSLLLSDEEIASRAEERWLGFGGGTAIGLSLAIHVLLHRTGRSAEADMRGAWLRRCDALAFNVLASLVAAEALLLVFARVHPSPWLQDDDAVLASVVSGEEEATAGPAAGDGPYARRNARGFPDDEFFVRSQRDFVAVLIADSFGVGVVPHEFKFTTVAETVLRERTRDAFERIALHDVAVAGIGPREYLQLFDREARRWNPQRVVLCVFAGNDLTGSIPAAARVPLLEDHLRIRDWKVATTARNVRRMATEVESRPQRGAEAGADPAGGTGAPTFEELMRRAATEPTFTEDGYLRLEQTRLRICDPDDPFFKAKYAVFFELLDDFAARARPFDPLLVVIPDEFQVDEALFARLLEGAEESRPRIVRDLPQQRIAEWAQRTGVEVLDLLPALRAAQRSQPTYHLRDSHWNAWGNRVAGEALGAALARKIAPAQGKAR